MSILLVKSLYIHFPYCQQLCNYCDFHKHILKSNDLPIYQQQLQINFDHHQSIMHRLGLGWGKLQTCYVGGGTPSLWGQQGAKFLSDFFARNNLSLIAGEQREFTIEMNPHSVGESDLAAWEEVGVNRYSVGVQSMDERFLPVLNRIHCPSDVHRTLQLLNKRHVNFSVDLMLGLPFSHDWQRDIIAEIKQLLDYYPPHLSIYILTVKDTYVYAHQLPSDDMVAEEFLKVADFLSQQGFIHYEVSNYSLSGKQSKHNLSYWNGDNVAALGPSATGLLVGKETTVRYRWPNSNNGKVGLASEEYLTERELYLERIYLRLRTNQPIHLDWCEERWQQECFAKILSTWVQRGHARLLEIADGQYFSMTSQGMLILDSLMDQLFREKIL